MVQLLQVTVDRYEELLEDVPVEELDEEELEPLEDELGLVVLELEELPEEVEVLPLPLGLLVPLELVLEFVDELLELVLPDVEEELEELEDTPEEELESSAVPEDGWPASSVDAPGSVLGWAPELDGEGSPTLEEVRLPGASPPVVVGVPPPEPPDLRLCLRPEPLLERLPVVLVLALLAAGT